MTEVGWATLGIIPSFDGFERNLQSGTSRGMASAGTSGGTIFGNAAGKSAGARFGSLFKTAAKASLVGLAGAGALAFKLGADSVSAASDLEESTNKVAQVFGKNADSIFKFTASAADALGQTNTAARDAAATFGIFGNAAGLSDRKSAKFSRRMVTLASDLASFNNTEPDQAVEALGAALRGESEPIRAYGVLLDEATLKAEALELGLLKPVKNEAQISAAFVDMMEAQKGYNEAVKESGAQSLEALDAEASLGLAKDKLTKATEGTIPPLTQQQKLLAAQSEIFKQTEVAQGDFARTSDGLANQQRRLSARFEDAKAKLGAGLLPIMTDAADFLLDKGIPAFEDFADWFGDKGIPKIKEFGGFLKDDVVPVLKDLAEFAGTAAGKVGDIIGFINKLPSEAKLAGLAALVSGGAALKLRGGGVGGGGLLGTAGTALGLAKPVNVFVTNPGFGAGGGPGGIVPAGGPKIGTLPALAPLIPVGLGSIREETRFDPENVGNAEDYVAALKAMNTEWDVMGPVARAALRLTSQAFADAKLPTQLKTEIAITGVPESKAAVRDLIGQYALTPKQKQTTFELLGFDTTLDRAKRINDAYDYAARDRRMKITVDYDRMGYETRGGLQEGGGGPVTRSRSRSGGGI